MTRKLATLMHARADAIDFAMPDLDAIERAGGRQVRRRRLGAAGLAATAVLAIGATVTVIGGSDGGGRNDTVVDSPPVSSYPVGPITYSTGSLIHYGDQTIDAGVSIEAFVQTEAGFVVASGGVVRVVDGTGSHTIGSIAAKHPRLASDEGGNLVGWVQSGPETGFVIHDVSAGTTEVHAIKGGADPEGIADTQDPAYFYAIDDTIAYWRDARGAVAFDTASGTAEVVDPSAANGFDIVDVQGGQIAFSGEQGVEIGPDRETAKVLPGALEGHGALSPDATHFAPDAELLRIVEAPSGTDVGLSLPGYFFSTAYAWLGDDTVAVIALEKNEKSPINLLTCSVTDRTCGDPVMAGVIGDVQLPLGWVLGE